MKAILNKSYGLILVVMLIAQGAFAQPPNNTCGSAFATTPDGTCYGPGLPETTTVNATDNWVGSVGCQGGGNNVDVWFSFVATQSQVDFNVTAGTMGGNIEIFLVSSTGPCLGLGAGLSGSACGASPLNATFNGLQTGVTYYYTISSTGADGTFTTCVTSSTPVPVPGQDCPVAAILCDDTPFSQGSSSAGFGAQEVSGANSCWGFGGERQSKWFHFTIGCSGTLEFNIDPVNGGNGGDDYDWAIWEITGDLSCGTMGNSINCDWSGCGGSTGITTCPNAVGEPGRNSAGGGCGGQPAAWEILTMNVVAGETYALLVDNFTTSNSGFSLTFGGGCGGGTAVIGPDADFTFGLDATCMIFSATKVCQPDNNTYLWTYGDGNTSTGVNGANVYATTGTYTVTLEVTDELGCTKTISQIVDIGCLLPVELESFDAELLEDNTVALNWTTASEDDNDYFTVQRSIDGTSFENIGTVNGADNSTTASDYQFIDRYPLDGTSYYRIKQTDNNGGSTVTNTIAVNFTAVFDQIAVYPNPVKDNSVLSYIGNTEGATEIVVTDITGKILLVIDHTTKLGNNTIALNTSQMNSGVYFVMVSSDAETKSIRFVKE